LFFYTSGTCGPDKKFHQIEVTYWRGFFDKQVFETCFDPVKSRSVWSKNILFNEIGDRETGSSGMPSNFDPDTFFPEFDVNTAYSKVS